MAQNNDIHDHPITVFTACTSITKVLFRRDRVMVKLYMYSTYRYIYTYIIMYTHTYYPCGDAKPTVHERDVGNVRKYV